MFSGGKNVNPSYFPKGFLTKVKFIAFLRLGFFRERVGGNVNDSQRQTLEKKIAGEAKGSM